MSETPAGTTAHVSTSRCEAVVYLGEFQSSYSWEQCQRVPEEGPRCWVHKLLTDENATHYLPTQYPLPLEMP